MVIVDHVDYATRYGFMMIKIDPLTGLELRRRALELAGWVEIKDYQQKVKARVRLPPVELSLDAFKEHIQPVIEKLNLQGKFGKVLCESLGILRDELTWGDVFTLASATAETRLRAWVRVMEKGE